MASWVARIRGWSRDDRRTVAIRSAVVLAVIAVLVFGWQAVTAARALNDAKDRAGLLIDAISSGEVERATRELKSFDEATSRAHRRTDGPLWWVGAKVPLLGRNVAAVSTVAEQADAISDQALPGIVAVADDVRAETFRPKNGRVDLAAVAKALPTLAATDRVMARADREVAAIRPDRLIGPLQGPVGEFVRQTRAAASAAAAAHDAGRLLPTMLGAEGPRRRYLLMVLNNAEVRSIGGMPGSFAVVEARRGKVAMKEQVGNTEMERLDKPRLSIRPELRAGFEKNVGLDIRDAAIIPDFPRVAALASAIAGVYWDTKFDGVVAIDPVALGYVLGAVGPLDVGDGLTINQTNAASTLLSAIYLKYPRIPEDAAAQDDAFERAARRSFDALTGGQGDSVTAVRALVRGVQERRVLLWSRHATEQKRIQSTGIAGSMTDMRQRQRPQVGVYLTDTSQAKLDFYLRMKTQVEAKECYAGGVQDIRMTTTISSDVPPRGAGLPVSVVGFGKRVPLGDMGLNVRIAAPPKGTIRSIIVDGRQVPVGAASYRGRQLSEVERIIAPGESTAIVTEIRTGPSMAGDPLLKSTPTVTASEDLVGPSACN